MQYMQYGVVYQVDVVFPMGRHVAGPITLIGSARRYDITSVQPQVPHMRKRITASALVDFCLGRRSYFAVRTQSRRSSQVFDLIQTEQGIVAQDVDLPDLLTHYVLHAMPGAERRGADWINFVTKDFVGTSEAC